MTTYIHFVTATVDDRTVRERSKAINLPMQIGLTKYETFHIIF